MIKNIFANLPNINSKDEEFLELFKHKSIRIERVVSTGQISSFWYEQSEDEFVLLLDGEAILEFEDSEVVLNIGDYIFIPALKKHKVKFTKKDNYTIWLCIFFEN